MDIVYSQSETKTDSAKEFNRDITDDLAGVTCIEDLEKLAASKLDKGTFEYYSRGADDELTLGWNRSMITHKYCLRSRVMCNVEQVDLTHYVYGDKLAMPVGVSPTAMHKMAHPDGERATVRACNRMNSLMILSLFSNTSLEEVAKTAPICTKWQNLVILRDKEALHGLISRAIRYGYRALVVTCDAPCVGNRRSDTRNGFKIGAYPLENLNDPRSMSLKDHSKEVYNATATWQDLADLKKHLGDTIKVIAKGIMCAEDAEEAIKAGVDGIFVSNHGGRQLDSLPATIEVLPSIVRVVNKRCPVFVDGGFRTGTDILKGLALGADMVFVGRAALYGLASSGEDGVYRALKLLQEELTRAMMLCGCSKLSDISRKIILDRSALG